MICIVYILRSLQLGTYHKHDCSILNIFNLQLMPIYLYYFIRYYDKNHITVNVCSTYTIDLKCISI